MIISKEWGVECNPQVPLFLIKESSFLSKVEC